jgi:hypothetical protein
MHTIKSYFKALNTPTPNYADSIDDKGFKAWLQTCKDRGKMPYLNEMMAYNNTDQYTSEIPYATMLIIHHKLYLTNEEENAGNTRHHINKYSFGSYKQVTAILSPPKDKTKDKERQTEEDIKEDTEKALITNKIKNTLMVLCADQSEVPTPLRLAINGGFNP